MREIVVLLLIAVLLCGCYSAEMRRRRAQLWYEKGVRRLDSWDLKVAQEAFEFALWLDPNHEAAREKLATVRRLRGYWGPDEMEVEKLDEIYRRKKTGR